MMNAASGSANVLQRHTEGVRKKTNKSFMILSAMGILFVIDSHCGAMLGLNRIFPYDSFFMPLFVFISGYFFREETALSLRKLALFARKKFRTLVMPWCGWICFYGVVVAGLTNLGILDMPSPDFRTLLNSLFYFGISYGFNDPSWFIEVLFLVNALHGMLRYLFRKSWNDSRSMLVYWILGTCSIYISANKLYSSNMHILVLKILFFLQFFQLGIVFRKRFEKWFDSANTAVTLLLCVTVNIVLLIRYGSSIAFPSCTFMGGFTVNQSLLPFITSITGIAFCLKLAKSLDTLLGNNRLVNFISDNTFFIITNHLLAKTIANAILWLCASVWSVPELEYIDLVQIKTNAWYVCSGEYARMASALLTLLLVLGSCWLWNKAKASLFKMCDR